MSPPMRLELQVRDESRTIELTGEQQGERLSRVLRDHDLPLNTRCGGNGTCDGCVVDLIDARGDAKRIRACQHRPADLGESAVRITIPARSLLAHAPQVVSNFKLKIPWADAPLWTSSRPGVDRPLGVAVDVGTTTVAIMLVDLSTGKVFARGSAFNQQMRYADDVLSRINLCSTDPAMLEAMQKAVVRNTLQPLVRDACASADVPLQSIVCYTVAANTTMLHLLAGVDPSPMGIAPFTPNFLEHRTLHTRDVGLDGDARVHLLPGAAAYVGADLTAGCVVTGQAWADQPILLVDVGTNGEIILRHDGRLIGCATAAGPAFEGARLSSGMRAADGAIEHVRFDDALTVDLDVIGRTEATGVCGSAYLDLLTEGRRVGLLGATGRFDREHHTISTGEHGKSMRLAGDNGNAVTITESDIASLLQAKAAIGAGVVTLMRKLDLAPADLHRVYLAGGFGLHIDPKSAVGSGLLPGFDPQQIESVGNTSLGGAYLSLLDRGILDAITTVAAEIEVVELNHEPEFEMNYIDQLSLP